MRNSGKPISSYSPAVQAQITAQLHGFKMVSDVKVLPASDPEAGGRKQLLDAVILGQVVGIPDVVREHRFDRVRRWRFDYAWPKQKVALEVEGGIWTGGRHTRGKGFLGDMEKYNRAVVLGWRVVRCTPDKLTAGATIEMLQVLLK